MTDDQREMYEVSLWLENDTLIPPRKREKTSTGFPVFVIRIANFFLALVALTVILFRQPKTTAGFGGSVDELGLSNNRSTLRSNSSERQEAFMFSDYAVAVQTVIILGLTVYFTAYYIRCLWDVGSLPVGYGLAACGREEGKLNAVATAMTHFARPSARIVLKIMQRRIQHKWCRAVASEIRQILMSSSSMVDRPSTIAGSNLMFWDEERLPEK
ncbi:hypothetical protein BV898_00760 [Hypsibius exemplaris]|uniref:Uncharacterized protein n=1 Tax=Hypsibius exemplaris TaxID=2072580 RepID=A0A1W0XEG1_HYPEX|nr:hypothetical protein BV898_00760 [Hypsibius exemplaris]